MEEVEERQTKVCKCCGQEKPVNEFQLKGKNKWDSKCKVCKWFANKNNLLYKENWAMYEYLIIIDHLLNKKSIYINDICQILNKDIKDVCDVISNYLKVSGVVALKVKTKCDYCNNTIIIPPSTFLKSEKHYCCKKCSDEDKKGVNFHKVIGRNQCIVCKRTFDVFDNVPNQKFCSSKCKTNYYNQRGIYKIEVKCDNCNNIIKKNVSQVKKYKHTFCSIECELKFKHKQAYEYRTCEICGKQFETLKKSPQRFCSTHCQAIWQSKYLVGKNANTYNHNYSDEYRTVECQICGKNFKTSPYKIKHGAKFCSDNCRQKWFADIWSQQEEWKEASRKRTVELLSSGVMPQTATTPHKRITQLLTNLNIKYTEEKNYTYYSCDIFLDEYNLPIEIMGAYWHTDNRVYKQIRYAMQKDRIKIDKAKHSYIKNEYDVEILYLWEKDIMENIDLCKYLILQFIHNNGILRNYHSFNYLLSHEGLLLNSNIITPYMDWDIQDLNEIVDLSVKEKECKKQEDKWTQFKCEYCGRESEELTCNFNKKQHHYCSSKCSQESRRYRITVKCSYCGKEIKVIKSKYEKSKSKHFFCNREHWKLYNRIKKD